MSEAISYIAAAQCPAVFVNIVRGGPGLGGILGPHIVADAPETGSMGLDHASLSDAELTGLARVCRRDPADLAAELHRRPWAIHDILAAPAVVEEVLDPDDLIEAVSPFVQQCQQAA